MAATRDTNWRHLGVVPYETWRALITKAGGSPGFADKRVWAAYGDDSALALAQSNAESSYARNYDKIPESFRDPLNLQINGKGVDFSRGGSVAPVDAYVVGAKEYLRRLYSADYKDGVYTKTVSIYDMVSEFAPRSDGNNPEAYSDKIAELINSYGVTTPSGPAVPAANYIYTNGVLPPIEQITVSESKKFAGYINPADHIIRAFIIHSAYGYLLGTTTYFQQGNALTDYMVGNSSDGDPALDGRLRQFNDPFGPRYSWASGPVSNPIEDAAKFLEIYGPNKEVINMFTTALERSGDSRNAVTEKEHAKRVALIAYHANRYGKYLFDKTGEHRFTCDTFPLIPSENNRSFLIYHGEINDDKRTTCPDAQVRATLNRIIADVKALLAKWQKGGAVPTDPPVDPPDAYAKPVIIDALQAYKDKDAAPAYVTVGNDTFIFVNDRVRATKVTPRYQTANKDGKRIGADINAGEEFAVLWLFFDEKDQPWYISPYWTRIFAGDTARIADEA